MTNTKRAAITFDAAGTDYKFKLSTNAMVRFQDATGADIMSALGKFDQSDSFDIRTLRALFWAGLSVDSEDTAGDIMDELGLEATLKIITDGVAAAFPSGKEGAGGNSVPPKPGKEGK